VNMNASGAFWKRIAKGVQSAMGIAIKVGKTIPSIAPAANGAEALIKIGTEAAKVAKASKKEVAAVKAAVENVNNQSKAKRKARSKTQAGARKPRSRGRSI